MTERKMTKGERTAERILDIAEVRFAEKGFKGTNVRDIAAEANIKQSALYRHFNNKQAIYQAVLERSLRPLMVFLEATTQDNELNQTFSKNPEAQLAFILEQVIDILAAHPHIAFLFQQAMMTKAQSQEESKIWLNALIEQGQLLAASMDNTLNISDPETAVIRLIALYNLCVGYFSSAIIIEGFLGKSVSDPELLKKQKKLIKNMAKGLI